MKKLAPRQHQNLCLIHNFADDSTDNLVDKILVHSVRKEIELKNKLTNAVGVSNYLNKFRKFKIRKFEIAKNFYLNSCLQTAWPHLCYVADWITKTRFCP